MTPILQDVQADIILPDLKAMSGKEVLQILATEVALRTCKSPSSIYDRLIQQEEESASGIGGGVAIPHMQMEDLTAPLMILARLDQGLDFNSIDQQNVDLIFLLVSPKEEAGIHLRRLSRISRTLKNEALCSQLRAAKDAHEMRALLGLSQEWLVAA